MIEAKTIECPLSSRGVCKTLSVREMNDGEQDKVMKILKQSFSRQYDEEKDFWKEIIELDPTLVIEMNDEIVGASSVRNPQLIGNQTVSWIDLVAIDPQYRRIELGKTLLEESEKLMRKMGAKKGRLHAEVDNTEAVSFYSKHKWKVAERTEWGYRDAHRLTMEKIL